MRKILIIGGCGYIGSKLFQYLRGLYGRVDTVDLEWYGNYANPNNLHIDYFNLTKEFLNSYDVIILIAAHSSVKMCDNNLIPTFKNNVYNFVNLLSKINSDKTLIYASSSSVYGNIKSKFVDETCNEFVPGNYYDLCKQQIDSYSKLSSKRYYSLRFGTVNGSSPNFRNDIMINAMVHNAKKNNKIYCFNPKIHRPILGMADLCEAFHRIIEDGNFGNRGIYNLASFNSTSEEIASKVADCLNVPMEITDNLPHVVQNVKLQSKAYDFSIDCSKFEKEFNFTFKETIESIVESIINNYHRYYRIDGRSNAKIY